MFYPDMPSVSDTLMDFVVECMWLDSGKFRKILEEIDYRERFFCLMKIECN